MTVWRHVTGWLEGLAEKHLARDEAIRQWEKEIIVSQQKTTVIRKMGGDPITRSVRGQHPARRTSQAHAPQKTGE